MKRFGHVIALIVRRCVYVCVLYLCMYDVTIKLMYVTDITLIACMFNK